MKAFRRLPLVTTMRADLNKMVDTMRHIFKVHFFFCLLASRAPWFECSVSRFSSYTCKERYHKPLASCLGWEDSKEKKKKKGKEKKRKEKKRNVKDRLRGKNSRKTEKFPWGMGQSKDLERKRESEREGEREERERRERERERERERIPSNKQTKKHPYRTPGTQWSQSFEKIYKSHCPPLEKKISIWVMVAVHFFILSSRPSDQERQRQADCCEFEATLFCSVSFRTGKWQTQRNPVLKKKCV